MSSAVLVACFFALATALPADKLLNLTTTVAPTTTGPPRICSEYQFTCSPGICVPLGWLCDGVTDCPDGEDEQRCDKLLNLTTTVAPTTTGSPRICPKDQFMCSTGVCVPLSWLCDGVTDCPDGEDEQPCDKLLNNLTTTTAPTTTGEVHNLATTTTTTTTDELAKAMSGGAGGAGGVVLSLPAALALDQDVHFALSLAAMLRARTGKDKLDAQVAVLRLFRELPSP